MSEEAKCLRNKISRRKKWLEKSSCRCRSARWNSHLPRCVSAPAKVGSLSRRELNTLRKNLKCLIINLDTSFSIRGDDFKMILSEHWRCARWRYLIFRNSLLCVGKCCFSRCSLNHSFSAMIATNEKQEITFHFGSKYKMKKTRAEME